MELVENACRHGAASEPVDIAVTEHDSTACLRVTSAGPPISENLLHRGSEDDSSRGLVSQWFAGSRLPTAESWTMSRRPGAM